MIQRFHRRFAVEIPSPPELRPGRRPPPGRGEKLPPAPNPRSGRFGPPPGTGWRMYLVKSIPLITMGKDHEGFPGKPGAVDAGRSVRGQDSTTRQYIWCYSEQGPARKRPAENAAGTPRIFAATAESNRNDKCVLLTLPVCGQAAEKNGRSAASTAPRSEPIHSGANAPIRPLLNSAIIAAAIGVCALRILRRKHCLRDSQDQSVSGYSMCDPTVRICDRRKCLDRGK